MLSATHPPQRKIKLGWGGWVGGTGSGSAFLIHLYSFCSVIMVYLVGVSGNLRTGYGWWQSDCFDARSHMLYMFVVSVRHWIHIACMLTTMKVLICLLYMQLQFTKTFKREWDVGRGGGVLRLCMQAKFKWNVYICITGIWFLHLRDCLQD